MFLSGSKGNVSDMGRSMERKRKGRSVPDRERGKLTDDYGQL